MSDNKKDNNEKRSVQGWLVIPFFTVLALLTAISLIIPLRPTRSNMEKRDLAKFPEFSVEALLSGDYFDDITLWFSDTFPGREDWITVATYTESLHGYSEVSIGGELPVMETVPQNVVPQPERPTEPAEPIPETTEQTVEAETETETEPAATESEEWGGVDAGDAAEILKSATAIQIGDSVFTAQGFSQTASDKYAQVVNEFALAMKDKGVTVVSAPPPTAIGILIEEAYLEKLNCVSQADILNYIHGSMYESVVTVDTVSALLEHNDEYIYFRTDHHWTALGAYYSYAAVCREIGMEPVELGSMEVWNQGDFKGSLYGKASRPNKLRLDTVDVYIPNGDIVHTAHNNGGSGMQIPVIADFTEGELNTKYLAFGTDYPMSHAENRSLPDAPNVLLIKDSFGNCFWPFMTQNFHNVYSVDYRKFRTLPLVHLVDTYDIDYVIFMPYVTATQASDGHLMVRRLCFG